MSTIELAALAMLLVGSAGTASAAPPPVRAGWTATGMEQPESVYFDPVSRFIFVSNMAGAPTEKDGRGWISKLDESGKVIAPKWVDGLDAPRGLRSTGDTLWVTNITEVLSIRISDGKITARLPAAGAIFLNDTAIASDGTVYVSDSQANRIYAVKDGRVSVWAEGDHLEAPNGLLAERNRLVVGGIGKFGPKGIEGAGHLFALDLTTKQKTLITANTVGVIDGVESDGSGGYVLTNGMTGELVHVTASGSARVLQKFENGSFDHAYLPDGKVAIIPHRNGTVGAYTVSLQ